MYTARKVVCGKLACLRAYIDSVLQEDFFAGIFANCVDELRTQCDK